MKARIKGTDAVIRVQPIYSVDGLHIEQFVNTANGDLFQPHTVDIIPNDTDWGALRNQAAIAAMQGVICVQKGINNWDIDINKLANVSVIIANRLIEELKKK